MKFKLWQEISMVICYWLANTVYVTVPFLNYLEVYLSKASIISFLYINYHVIVLPKSRNILGKSLSFQINLLFFNFCFKSERIKWEFYFLNWIIVNKVFYFTHFLNWILINNLWFLWYLISFFINKWRSFLINWLLFSCGILNNWFLFPMSRDSYRTTIR